jgi:hypothetical protein
MKVQTLTTERKYFLSSELYVHRITLIALSVLCLSKCIIMRVKCSLLLFVVKGQTQFTLLNRRLNHSLHTDDSQG